MYKEEFALMSSKLTKAIGIADFIAMQQLHKKHRIENNRILFLSDVRDELGGNLLSVYEAVDKSKWNCDVYCRDKQLHPQTRADIKAISEKLNAAAIVLLEDVMPFLEFYEVKEGQQIIQLWHACGAYKKFGFSRQESGLHVSKSHNKYTLATTSADSIKGCYADAYGISEDRIAPTGVPRTDVFHDENWKKQVRETFLAKHPEIGDRKIVLLAPTYRGTRIHDAGYDMSMLPWDYFEKELAGDYVLVTKWHPAMYNNLRLSGGLEDMPSWAIDASAERDVNDILPAADILITDYSSVIFEWSLLDRPIIYYAYDEADYQGGRGLYYPFHDYVYGQVARNPEELVGAIKEASVDEVARTEFVNRFMAGCDGNATDRVIRLIEEVSNGVHTI